MDLVIPGGNPPPPAPKAPDAPAAPAGGAPAAADKPTTAEDFFELMLDGETAPRKIPVSKLPVEKLNPHLAKLRSDADRRMSEADRRTKELDSKAERYGSIEKLAEAVAKDPSKFIELGKTLGLTQEKLWELSESQINDRIRREMQASDEAADPAKKQVREDKEELEKLRAEKKQSDQERETRETQQVRQGVERLMVSALDKFKPDLKQEAAREMSVILRAAFQQDKTLTSDELADAAKRALGWRASRYYADDSAELDDTVLKRAEAILAKRAAEKPVPHPSQKPNPGKAGDLPARGPDGKFTGKTATDVMMDMLYGKSKQ